MEIKKLANEILEDQRRISELYLDIQHSLSEKDFTLEREGKQIQLKGKVLFTEWRTGADTDALEIIKKEHPEIQEVIDWREKNARLEALLWRDFEFSKDQMTPASLVKLISEISNQK